MRLGTQWKYLPALAVLAMATLFSLYQFDHFDMVGSHEISSILAEGFVMLLVLAGVFVVQHLRDTKSVYYSLMTGFSALFVSMLTDTLDEILQQPRFITLIFEDLLQIIGYLFVVIGLWRWTTHNQNLRERLQQLATTDQLTGAGNRRCFGKALVNEVERANLYGKDLSLIMFDLDGFKRINDEHGHKTGDSVLVKISELVRGQIRKNDVFARIGGEEFVVLIPSTKLEGATQTAEKLRTVFEQTPIEPAGIVTASFGVTTYSKGDNMDDLLKRSDNALYEAKQAGRNCVRKAC